MVKVNISGEIAEIKDYKWTGDNDALVGLLNAMLDFGGPAGDDPHPSLTAAQNAIARLGGEIVHSDEVEYVEGRIY